MLPAETELLAGNESLPIKEIRDGEILSAATGWGEIGKTVVADVFAQFDHKGPLLTLTTSRGAVLRCSPDHKCFGRFNPLIRQNYIYLMERSSFGFRLGFSADLMKDLFTMQSLKIDLFNQQEIIDRIWIVETYENFPRARFMYKFAVFKYGLPDIPFSAKHPDSELSDEAIAELFNRIDTPSRAHQLLMDWLMFEEHPHITFRVSKASPGTSNAIQFIIFGGTEKNRKNHGFVHLIRIDGALEMNSNDAKHFKRRMSNRGVWNLEVTRDDLDEAQLFVKTLSCLDNLEIVKKIQLTKKAPFYILPASHLKLGMSVPVLGKRGIEEDTIVSIKTDDYQGPLYDLRVEGLYNYIAGHWVTMSFSGNSGPGKLRERGPV